MGWHTGRAQVVRDFVGANLRIDGLDRGSHDSAKEQTQDPNGDGEPTREDNRRQCEEGGKLE